MKSEIRRKPIERRLDRYARLSWRIFNKSPEGRELILEVFDQMIESCSPPRVVEYVQPIKKAFLESEVTR